MRRVRHLGGKQFRGEPCSCWSPPVEHTKKKKEKIIYYYIGVTGTIGDNTLARKRLGARKKIMPIIRKGYILDPLTNMFLMINFMYRGKSASTYKYGLTDMQYILNL